MHVLVIEYSGRVVPESTASYIGESAIEKNLCDAFDKLNIATLNELLSGMKQLYSEFQVIHKQLTQCKRPSLEYAYTMGDLYGIVLGMSGQYQAISDIISKLSSGSVTETLQTKAKEGESLLKHVAQAWRELETFFTDEVNTFRDVFYEDVPDNLAGQEAGNVDESKGGPAGQKPEGAPFNDAQMKWLREELSKMLVPLPDQGRG